MALRDWTRKAEIGGVPPAKIANLLSCPEEKAQSSRIAKIAGGQAQKQEPEPESLRVFSKALGREITVSWNGDDPAEVYVEGQPYSLAEIEELKDLGPEAAKAAHEIKTVFMGAHIGQSEEDPPEEPGPPDYDAEITAVIHEFDMAGVLPTEAPEEIRKETLALEDEITEACNAGDVPRFRAALHAWRLAWMRSLH